MATKTDTDPGLPPGCEYKDGVLVRVLKIGVADGSIREQVRRVTLDWDEARKLKIDFHHPEFGWIRGGSKLERDRPSESIMADTSVPLLTDRPE